MTVPTRAELVGAALVGAAVLFYAVNDIYVLDNVAYLTVIVATGVAAWVGAVRAPVTHRRVGRLIAAGLCVNAVGEILWVTLDATGGSTDVSVADPAFMAAYVFIIAALIIVLRRSGAASQDLAFVIDAATILVVCGLVFWSTAIDAIVDDDAVAVHVRAVWSTYPIADAVLLALVVRVLTSAVARSSLDNWFAAGVCVWLATDIAYLSSPEGGAEVVMDTGWMIAPTLIARSVWRLGRTPAPAPVLASYKSREFQLVIAVVPLLVPPALEVIADLRGEPDQPLLLTIGASLLTVLAFVRMARLIRSEEQALRQLEVARDAALEASQAKSMFLATMSHEIRTPLTTVLGAGEMLEDTPLDDLQLELVERMRRSGARLRALVDGILDFSRIEAGQLHLTKRPFVLTDLMDGLSDASRPRAEAGGINFDCVIDPSLPHTVEGDPDRLLQVVGNLVDNAMKFTHEGGVRVEVRPLSDIGDDEPPGTHDVVEFKVTDTGIGIPAEQLVSVFESFKQVDGSTTRRYGGTGLGLAICLELSELMGGSLTVTSDVGVGSVFTARIPLPPAADSAADPAAEPAAEPVGEHAGAQPVPPATDPSRQSATTAG